MAAITFTKASNDNVQRIRTATAQATTGQTDWIAVPSWARTMRVYKNLTAVAGSVPSQTMSFLDIIPVTLNDTYSFQLSEHGNLAAQTAACMTVVDIGPNAIADDTTVSATANSYAHINTFLPQVIGIKLLQTHTDETYTYTITVSFRA